MLYIVPAPQGILRGLGILFIYLFIFLKSAVMTYPRFAVHWIYDPVKVTQNKTRLDASYRKEQD